MEIHRNLRNKLKMMIDNKKIPHIIFHGPSGSGKRSLLEDFIRKMSQSQAMNTAVILIRNVIVRRGVIYFAHFIWPILGPRGAGSGS